MQRKHAKLIKQWAEDTSLVIEVQMDDGLWRVVTRPVWDERFEYRIAMPEPKKIKLSAYLSEYELRWLNIEAGNKPSPTWIAVPSEDKEITLP